jgi:hypothetical protein
MAWLHRRWAPWLLVTLQASAGSFTAGLVAVGWSLWRLTGRGVECYLTACTTRIALTALLVTSAYFLASAGTAVAIGASEVTGAEAARVRSWLAVTGPPLLAGVLTVVI